MVIKTETKGNVKNGLKHYYEKYKTNFKINNKLKEIQLVNLNKQLFNKISFNKYEAYMLISKLEELTKYVPEIEKAKDFYEIIRFAKEYERIILRPIDFCINAPVYFLEYKEDCIIITGGNQLQYINKKIYCQSELKEIFQLYGLVLDNYFLQKFIRYFKTDELLSDMHLTMKKTARIDWRCSSIEFLMGNNKIFFNKILDPSEKKYLNVLKKALPVGCKLDSLIKQINIICQKSCCALGKYSPFIYEYVFDLAIDKEKKLWITDINILISYKDFKQIDYKTFSNENASILYEAVCLNFK